MASLIELAERVESAMKADRHLDFDVAVALGGKIRKVTGIGTNGRTPGRQRVFWPWTTARTGSPVPYYTKNPASKAKAVAVLRALASTQPGGSTT